MNDAPHFVTKASQWYYTNRKAYQLRNSQPFELLGDFEKQRSVTDSGDGTTVESEMTQKKMQCSFHTYYLYSKSHEATALLI